MLSIKNIVWGVSLLLFATVFNFHHNLPHQVNASFNLEGIAYIDSLYNGIFDTQSPIDENTVLDYGEKVSLYLESVSDPSINFEQRTNDSSAFLFEQIDDGCYKLSVIIPSDLRWEFIPVLNYYNVCGNGDSSNGGGGGGSTSTSTGSNNNIINNNDISNSDNGSSQSSTNNTQNNSEINNNNNLQSITTATTSSIVTIRQDVAFAVNSFMGCNGYILNVKTGQSMNLQFGTYNLRPYGWCVFSNTTSSSSSSSPSNCVTNVTFPNDCQAIVGQSPYQITVQYRGRLNLSFNRDLTFSIPNSGLTVNDVPKANINITLSYVYNNIITHSTMSTTTYDPTPPTFSVPLVEVSVFVSTDNITQIVLLNNITMTPTLQQPTFNVTISLYELPPLKDKYYVPVTLFSQSNRKGLSITLPAGTYSKEFLASLGYSNLSVLSFSSTYKYRVFLSVSTAPSAILTDIPLNGYFVESYNTGTIVQIQIAGNYEFSNNPLPIFGGYLKVLNVYHSLFKPTYYLAETPKSLPPTYYFLNCTDAPFMGYHNCSVPSRVGPRYIKTRLNNERFITYSEMVYYPDFYSARSLDSRLLKQISTGKVNISNIDDCSYNWTSPFTKGLSGMTKIITNSSGFSFQVAGKTIFEKTYQNINGVGYLSLDSDGSLYFYNGSSRIIISDTASINVDSFLLNREGMSLMIDNSIAWGVFAFPDQYWRYREIHPAAFLMSSKYLDALDSNRNSLISNTMITNGLYFALVNSSQLIITQRPSIYSRPKSDYYLELREDGALCWTPLGTVSVNGTLPLLGCLADGGLGGRYLVMSPQVMTWSKWALQILDERGRLVWAINSTEKIDYNVIPMEYGSYLHYTEALVSAPNDAGYRSFITNGKQYLQITPDGNFIVYETNVYVDREILAFTESVVSDPPYTLKVHDQGISLYSESYPNDPYFTLSAMPDAAPIRSLYMYPQAGDVSSPYDATVLSWGVLLIDVNGKVGGGLLGAQDNRKRYINSITISPAVPNGRKTLSPTMDLTNQFIDLKFNETTGTIEAVQLDNNQVVWSSPPQPEFPDPVDGSDKEVYYGGFVCTDSNQVKFFCVASCAARDPVTKICTQYNSLWAPLTDGAPQGWFGLIIGFPELVIVDPQGSITWSAKISNVLLREY